MTGIYSSITERSARNGKATASVSSAQTAHRWGGLLLPALLAVGCATSDNAGQADVAPDSSTRYHELRQVYDVAIMTQDEEAKKARLTHVMNVAAYHLGKTPLEDLHLTVRDRGPVAPEIVVVLHGSELDVFATKNAAENEDLLQTARMLHESGVRFRACRGAAWVIHKLKAPDMVDFVEMVPGGEAEIAYLQQSGFGYNFFQSSGP